MRKIETEEIWLTKTGELILMIFFKPKSWIELETNERVRHVMRLFGGEYLGPL